MARANEDRLARECKVFSSYLIGFDPSPYVAEKYNDAHQRVAGYIASRPFDRFLVRFAAAAPALTKLADSYACVFAPGSILRKKLILLLAILESSAPAHRFLDSVDAGGKALLFWRIFQKGLLFILSAAVAMILLLPFHVALGLGKPSGAGGH